MEQNMDKLYNKNELYFSLIFIAIYVVGASVCDMLSDMVNVSKIFTFPFLLALSLILFFWIKRNNLMEKYGLCQPKFTAKSFLFYIPLLVLISTNLWFGVKQNYNFLESVLNVLSMLCVGFAEEIIFRGFLFRAMEKDNVKSAIIVSSVTFGIGHIINLLSSGFNNIISNICQVFYAMAVGFLFVIIFYKSGSLIPCIITHSLVNALSIFQNPKAQQGIIEILISIAIIAVSVIYSLILIKTLKPNQTITSKDTENQTKI
jgi:membrane protease YdiL (CAAX protease family)